MLNFKKYLRESLKEAAKSAITPAPINIPCEWEGHCAWVMNPCCLRDENGQCIPCFEGWCCCNEDCEYDHIESHKPGYIPKCCVEGTCNCMNQDGTGWIASQNRPKAQRDATVAPSDAISKNVKGL